MISADGLRSGVQIGYVMEANQDFEISDPSPMRPVAGVFLADVSEGAHQVSSPCVAMSVGRSRKRDLAHSSAGPGACNGRLPHHESTGGPRLIAGEQSLLNVDSLMGKPLELRNETNCFRVIKGRPSTDAAGARLRRVLEFFSMEGTATLIKGLLTFLRVVSGCS